MSESNNPVVRDGVDVVVTDCASAEGGTKTVGVPEYTMVVTNPDDEATS